MATTSTYLEHINRLNEIERQRLQNKVQRENAKLLASVPDEYKTPSAVATAPKTETNRGEKNVGGLAGGLGYATEKLGLSFLRTIEGIWDFAAGGIADMFGADRWAERQLTNDWLNYNHADEWYNPGKGWKTVGDISGGIGTSVAAALPTLIGAAVTAASGGAAAPALVKGLEITGLAVAGLGAGGQNLSEAYKKTGELGLKEYAFGAATGLLEAGLEKVTGNIDLPFRGLTQSVKGAAKTATKNAARQGIIRTMGKEFLNEAFEEGTTEFLTPYLARMTYDPNAENASLQQIAYAAFVGGMSGAIMGGGSTTVKGLKDAYYGSNSGSEIAKRGETQVILKYADILVQQEQADPSGSSLIPTIESLAKDLRASMEKTGGEVKTLKQKSMLGDLNRTLAAEHLNEATRTSANYILGHLGEVTQAMQDFHYTDANGNRIVFSAEEILNSVTDKNGNITQKSIQKALESNTAFRTVAVLDAAGHLLMDTGAFVEDVFTAGSGVTQDQVNQFIENASDLQKQELGKLLGIEDWNGVEAQEVAERIDAFLGADGGQIIAERKALMQEFERSRNGKTGKKIPKRFGGKRDGIYRYEENGVSIAIRKEGNTYNLYDYNERTPSFDLSLQEVNAALKKYSTARTEAARSAQSTETVSEEGRAQETPSTSESVKESGTDTKKTAPASGTAAEIAAFARENVKDYARLNAQNKRNIRKIIREGRAKGVAENVIIDAANVAAHAKIDIVFDHDIVRGANINANGFYAPSIETIFLDSEADTIENILIHELDHAIRKSVSAAGKVETKISSEAVGAVTEDFYKEILTKYTDGKKMPLAKRIELTEDEVEASYAAEVFASKDLVRHLVAEKPSLMQKIKAIIKRAQNDYSGVPRLEKQAKRYYKQFKKWFDEFAAKRTYKTINSTAYAAPVVGDSARFSLPIEGQTVNAKTVTEQDVRTLLENAYNKKYKDGSYIPVRVNTPSVLIEAAQSIGKSIENLPILVNVKKARQMMYSQIQWAQEANTGTAHDFSVNDVIALIKAMDNPKKIIYQSADERYVEVVEFETEAKQKAIAVLDIGENKNPEYLNGYNGGFYQVMVTAFGEGVGYVEDLLERKGNKQIYPTKKKDASQRGSGNRVPSHLNESPFAISILDSAEKSNPSDENSSKKSSFPATDSLGNTLTKEQADYFKESKVRDENGNLLVMYQGAAEEFYTFDRKKSKPSNLYGRGFYFTNSESQARHYGKTRAFYLGVNNPVSTTERTITRAQMRKFLEAVAENEDYSIENYGTYDVAKVLSSVYDGGRSDFAMLQDVSSTAIGDLVEAIELFNSLNGTTYDGIILDTEVVTFRSNQANLIANKKPTVDPDMRFSLDLDGEDISVEVEERNDLIALHNLSEENLNRVLDLGGFPMPSIAVTAPELSYSNYGDISVVFGRETIDPEATSKNVVYDRDAWTPTAPRVDVKLDTKRVEGLIGDLERIVGEYPEYKRNVESFFDGNYRDNKGDYIVLEYDYRKESIGRRALEYPGLMAGYLLEQGKEIKPIYKETTYDVRNTTYTRSEAGELLEYVGITKDVTRNNITESKRQEILEKLKRYRADQIYNRIGKDLEYSKILEIVEGSVDAGYVSELLFMSEQYFRDDAGKKRYDAYATREKLQSEITDTEAFEAWIFEKIQVTMERKGIKKDVDVFDSRGRRKTFAQTHDEYNVENIVKAMSKGTKEGYTTFGMTAGALAANLSRQFKSVEDIRQARKYLKQISEEDLNAFNDKTYELYDELVSRIAGSRGDLLTDGRRRDEVGEILGKCAKVRPLTTEGIKRKFNSETRGYDLGYTFEDTEAAMAMTLFEALKHVPTTYFEAKPRRVVNFSEIKMVELPYSASDALKAKLSELSIPYEIYGKTDAERTAAINRLQDASFSLEDTDNDENANTDTRHTIKYPTNDADGHRADAVETFGTTNDFKVAGFVLPDGRMLNMGTLRASQRHKSISKVLPNVAKEDAVPTFLREGNVRIAADSPGIEMSADARPTTSQLNVLSRFVSAYRNKGRFYVDITAANGNEVGSLSYYGGEVDAEIIVGDIKRYYDTGRLPANNDISFSIEDAEQRSAAAENEFGTTSDFKSAGFVLQNGKMLKLPRAGARGVTHSEIERVFDDEKGARAVIRFIQEGNIRIKAESLGIEIGTERAASMSQLDTISRFISSCLRGRGVFYLDITEKNGKTVSSIRYTERNQASDVIGDIDDYYRRGRIPRERDSLYSGFSFSLDDTDYNAIIEKGAPIAAPDMTVGQMLKRVANNTHYKVFSKGKLLKVVKNFAGMEFLKAKDAEEFADAIWQNFNALGDGESVQEFAHDMARYIFARVMVDGRARKNVSVEAEERFAALSAYVQRLTFTEADIAELQTVLDNDGLRRVYGRWAYKGDKGGRSRRVPMDVFVTDIANELPGFAYLEDMHPADAFMALDKAYAEAREEVQTKTEPAFEDIPDEVLDQMTGDIEKAIIAAFNSESNVSAHGRQMDTIIHEARLRVNHWKCLHDRQKQRYHAINNLKYLCDKIGDLTTHKFKSATQVPDGTLDGLLKSLSKIVSRNGTVSVSRARKLFSETYQLYRSEEFKKNVLMVDKESGAQGLYAETIEKYLEILSGNEKTYNELYGEAFPTDGKGLSFAEIDLAGRVLSYFIKLYREYGKVYRNGALVDALPIAQNYVNFYSENAKVKIGSLRSIFTRLSSSRFMQSVEDPMTVFRQADLYGDGFWTEIGTQLRKAAMDAEVARMNIMREYDAFLNSHKKFMKNATGTAVEMDGVKIPRIVLLSQYCTLKRDHAWKGFALNGYSFIDLEGNKIHVDGPLKGEIPWMDVLPDISTEQRRQIADKEFERIAAERRAEIEKLLTDEDREYIRILERIYNEDARQLKVERDFARFGFTNATEGYYYPMARANIASSVDMDMKSEIERVSNASFNHDIVQGAAGELFIESADTLVRRHVDGVCQYAFITPAIDFFNRVYNLSTNGRTGHVESVKTATENLWKGGEAYVRKLVGDIQGVNKSNDSPVFAALRGGSAVAALGANPKVLLTQLTSLVAAANVLDTKSILKGIGGFLKGMGRDVNEYCPLAELRQYEGTAEMAQTVVDRRGAQKGTGSRVLDGIQNAGKVLMKGVGFMDRQVVVALFVAAQYQVEADTNGEIKVGTPQCKMRAAKLLETTILETQQNALATERSAMMRGGAIEKGATMYSADAMKNIGRLIDAVGETIVLSARIKAATDENSKAEYKKQRKTARRRAFVAAAVLAVQSAMMVGITQAFKWLYGKKDDEDETLATELSTDFFGNMLGGIPYVRDIYSLLTDGFDMEEPTTASINEMAKSVAGIVEAVQSIIAGDSSSKQASARSLRNLVYSLSQIVGFPVRNIYNIVYGLVDKISKKAAFDIDATFYEKNYESELKKALEDEDYATAGHIYDLIFEERTDSALNNTTREELFRLSKNGHKVLPPSVPKTVTVEGEEYALSEKEITLVQDKYEKLLRGSMKNLVKHSSYRALSDEQKAEAANIAFGYARNKAVHDVVGNKAENRVLVAHAVGMENAAVVHTVASGIASTDKDRKKKVVEAITQQPISDGAMVLLLYANGYSYKDGDIKRMSKASARNALLRYIVNNNMLTKEEKLQLATMCGFTVKNGNIVP